MKKQIKSEIETNRRKYTIIGGANFQFCTKNAIYLYRGNKINHELSKALGGIMSLKWGGIKFDDELVGLLKQVDKKVNELFKDYAKTHSYFHHV